MSVQLLLYSENDDNNANGYDAVRVTLTEDLMKLIEQRAKLLIDSNKLDPALDELRFRDAHEAEWLSAEYDEMAEAAGDEVWTQFDNRSLTCVQQWPMLPSMRKRNADLPSMKLYLWDRNGQRTANVYWSAFPDDTGGCVSTPASSVKLMREFFDEHSQCPY